jgi:PAS domain S-box-containing protein/putative nucleotidyltransferase with HDIG domain
MKDQNKTKQQLIHDLEKLREHNEECRILIEESKDAMIVTLTDGNFISFNRAAVDLFGYSEEELKTVNIKQLYVDVNDRKRFQREVEKKKSLRNYKVKLRKKDGREMDCIFTMTVRSKDGKSTGYHGIIRDVTDQKQAQELYSKLTQSSQAGVYVVQNGIFQFVNPHIEEYSGYSKNELVGRDSLSLVHPEDREMTRTNAINTLKGERQAPYEYRLITKDGEVRTILENVTAIDYFGARAVLANSMDITMERKTIDKLMEAEALESSILSAIPHAVIGLENRRIIFANDAVETVFGWKPEEVIAKMTRIFYRSDKDFEKIGKHFYPVLETHDTHAEEFPCRRKDGTDIICMVSTSRVGGILEQKRIVVVYEDITERKQAEEALRESEAKYSAVVEQAMYGVVIIQDEVYKFANRAMTDITGYSVDDLMGMTYLEIFMPEFRKLVAKRYKMRMAGKKALPLYETKIVCKNKTIKDVEVAFGIITIGGNPADMGYVRDITARKEAQEELTRTVERLQRRLEETVNALASITEKRDPYTAGHSHRVTQLAVTIAKEMSLSDSQLDGILVAGTLHDIGKIYEPSEILSKPGLLTDIEFLMMKVHPEIGYDILKNIEFPWPVAQIVLQHHERLDGSGYPGGLKDDEILTEAKILAVADVIDAMASHRPYRPSLGIKAALAEVSKNKGVLYDATVVDICVRLFNEKGFKFRTRRSSDLHLHCAT